MGARAIWALVALGAVAAATAAWWVRGPRSEGTAEQPSTSEPNAPAPEAPGPFRFTDVIGASGITFRHRDGATPMQYLPEVMGGGAAWLDYDRDGLIDLFLVQSGEFPPDPQRAASEPTSRLYRNAGDGTFVDVTAAAGIVTPGYGQGVTAGDYDNDGFPDLFVTHFDGGRLYHNEADGRGGRRFRDVTRDAGIALNGWCTSCAFGDVHGTGHLDLFVCRYLALDLKNYPPCQEPGPNGPVRSACGPQHFAGTRSFLFRNNGNGTFTDVSEAAGLDADGKALGVVILDLNDDGKPDIFVGNDEVLNHHFRNLGGGKFESVGLRSGTGATHRGRTMGSMGIEAGDLTGGGRPDLFITTYIQEGTVLFRNLGKGLFTDVSPSAGMFAASWQKVGWGTALFDPDNDGTLDLFVANGHTRRNAAELLPREDGHPQEYPQLAQAFQGNGKGTFREVSRSSGPYFGTPRVGRGVAMGDYDNDGRIDLAVTHVGDVPALLRNAGDSPHHWIRLELEGSRHRNPAGSNRDAVGAVVTVRAGGRTLVRYLNGGGSYYSAPDRRVLVGLGTADKVEEVSVRWPNGAGTVQRFGQLAADRSYKLIEGIAEPQPALAPPVRQTR
ncbi:CRTAC1 family protein [Gemmata sp. JC673]|uniref:CRTAC1 family protein n=1 Tax=Gemmata algarum TaxID=2975278 RepID=A0ABU5F353_9BACT|nr:CRTAC1 family protein [Gemmata algarum]MDY3560548.1 CRTAC1 family protein [Gemmata algarum]